MFGATIAFLWCIYQRDWCCNFDGAYVEAIVRESHRIAGALAGLCAVESDIDATTQYEFFLTTTVERDVNVSTFYDGAVHYARYREHIHRAHYCRTRALRLNNAASILDAWWSSAGYTWRSVELVREVERKFLLLYNTCIVNCYFASRVGLLARQYSINEKCKLR